MTALRLEPEVMLNNVRLIAVTQVETTAYGGQHGTIFSAMKLPVGLIICDARGKRFVALESEVDIGDLRMMAEQVPM